MHARSPKLLEDIRDAASFVGEVTQGCTLAQYSANRLHALVWSTVQTQLPALLRDVQSLLAK